MEDARTVFGRVIDAWNYGDPHRVRQLVSDDYRGHMLHVADGERTAADYGDRIARYRVANPGTFFEVSEQTVDGDTVWSLVSARLPDGRVAHGMNRSIIRDGQLTEEWAIWSQWLETSGR